MGGSTLLSRTVHVDGSDLDLECKTAPITDTGVEALVAVRLGICYVVLESKRLRVEQTMDGGKSQIAFILPWNDDPKGEQILHVFKGKVFLFHFSPHPRDVLGPALDRHILHAIGGKCRDDGRFGRSTPRGLRSDHRLQSSAHPIEGLRIEDLQGGVLEPRAEGHLTKSLSIDDIVCPYLQGGRPEPLDFPDYNLRATHIGHSRSAA